jgi:hypothetical protein
MLLSETVFGGKGLIIRNVCLLFVFFAFCGCLTTKNTEAFTERHRVFITQNIMCFIFLILILYSFFFKNFLRSLKILHYCL